MNEIQDKKIGQAHILYSELSYRIMACLFEVHNQLGPGFTEDIYERATILEFQARQIPFEEQKPVPVYYKGQLAGNYRLDLVVDEKVILELKAVSELSDLHKQQLLSYLRATGYRLGLLINFGAKKVQSQRITN